MLKNRIIALLAAAAITAALTFGITAAFPDVFTEGTLREGICYESTGLCPDATVAAVDGNTATADLYYYWLCNCASYLDSTMRQYYGTGIDWDMEISAGVSMSDYVRDGALNALKQQLVQENLAKKNHISIGEDAAAELAEMRSYYVEQLGGEEAYLDAIASLGLREESYNRINEADYLYMGLYQEAITPDGKLYPGEDVLLQRAADEGYITADHILIKTVDDSYQPLDEETLAQKKALAEDILAQLSGASYEEFAALADQYSEDPGRMTNPNGYTFTTGQMVAEFEEAAYALAEGEMSGIVETGYGYHILYRLPLSAEAASQMADSLFAEMIARQVEGAGITASSALDAVDAQAAYEAFLAAQVQG